MKKLISFTGFIFFIIALITVGCEKPLDKPIIGKWEAKFHKYQGYNVDVFVMEEVDTLEADELVIEIFEGGTGKTWAYGETESEFDWTMEGDTVTVSITSAKIGIMKWGVTIEKDKMTLSHSTPYSPGTNKSVTITRIVETMITKRVD
jgi:hypothetical protein